MLRAQRQGAADDGAAEPGAGCDAVDADVGAEDAMSEITSISDLIPDPKNARAHTPRNIGMIETALNEVGAARSIVIDEQGVILAGNGLIEAAAQAGIERVRVVEADGNEIIAVQRKGLTPEQKVKLALFDNRTNEISGWNASQLAEIADEGLDLSSMFFPHELATILERAGDEIIDAADLWKGMPEFEQEDLSDKYKSLTVHFATKDDYEAFARLVNQTLTDKSNFIWYPYKPTHGVPGSMQGYTVADES